MRTVTLVLLTMLAINPFARGEEVFSEELFSDLEVPRTDVSIAIFNAEDEPIAEVALMFQGYEDFVFVTDENGSFNLNLDEPMISGPGAATNGWIGAYPRGMQFYVIIGDPSLPGGFEYRIFTTRACTDCSSANRSSNSFTHKLGTGTPYAFGDPITVPVAPFVPDADDLDLAAFLADNPGIHLDFVADVTLLGDDCGTKKKAEIVKKEELDCSKGTTLVEIEYDNGHAVGNVDFTGDKKKTKIYSYDFKTTLTASASTQISALGVSLKASTTSGGSGKTTGKSSVTIKGKFAKDLPASYPKRCGKFYIKTQETEVTIRHYIKTCKTVNGVQTWSGWKFVEEKKHRIVTGWCTDDSEMTDC